MPIKVQDPILLLFISMVLLIVLQFPTSTCSGGTQTIVPVDGKEDYDLNKIPSTYADIKPVYYRKGALYAPVSTVQHCTYDDMSTLDAGVAEEYEWLKQPLCCREFSLGPEGLRIAL